MNIVIYVCIFIDVEYSFIVFPMILLNALSSKVGSTCDILIIFYITFRYDDDQNLKIPGLNEHFP